MYKKYTKVFLMYLTTSKKLLVCKWQKHYHLVVTINMGRRGRGRGVKYFNDVELLYPPDEFQTNLIFYRWNIKQKHHFYCIADTIKLMFFLCFSIKDQICLKIIKWFCCYSASTKTSFSFCSCSELLQLKFGKKIVAGKCKFLSLQDRYRGD